MPSFRSASHTIAYRRYTASVLWPVSFIATERHPCPFKISYGCPPEIIGNALRQPSSFTAFFPSAIEDLWMNRLERALIVPIERTGNRMAGHNFESDGTFPLFLKEVSQFALLR